MGFMYRRADMLDQTAAVGQRVGRRDWQVGEGLTDGQQEFLL